jgi:hypothetical protein
MRSDSSSSFADRKSGLRPSYDCDCDRARLGTDCAKRRAPWPGDRASHGGRDCRRPGVVNGAQSFLNAGSLPADREVAQGTVDYALEAKLWWAWR